MLEPNISWKVFRPDRSVTPGCLFLWIHAPDEILPGCSLCTFAFTIRQFNDFREVNMRNSSDIGPSEELVAADESIEAAQVLWHRAKTPLKKHDKGKIRVTNNCRVYLERPLWFLSIVKLRIYVKWIKNVRLKVWQLFIILPVPLGSKEAEGRRRGIVCMRYYPAGCHSDVGVLERAKLVGRSEKTRRRRGLVGCLGWRGASYRALWRDWVN